MSIIKGTNKIVAGYGGTKRSIGEVYFSQSALATDNSGALPLFTGETIASANTIYPDFYNWVLAHTELQCTSAEYESALSTYGECPKYVVIASSQNNTPSVSEIISMSDDISTLYYLRGTEISIDDPVFSSYNDAVNNTNSIGKVVNVYGSVDNLEEGFSVEYVNTDGSEPTFPTLNYEETLSVNSPAAIAETSTDSVSIRLPKLSNYIKAANTAEGIKNIEAGLPNIEGRVFQCEANYNVANGAFYNGGATSQKTSNGGGSGVYVDFNASRSSSVYGKSDTVTPASTTLYPWVVAYAAAIPASTAQAAEFQQGLSGKADTNLGNTIPSQSFKEMSVGWSIPDYSAGVDISSSLKVANSSWTVPSDGIIFAQVINNNVVYLFRKSGCSASYDNSQYTLIAINGEDYILLTDKADVKKGDIIYSSTNETNSGKIYFYPFKGVN